MGPATAQTRREATREAILDAAFQHFTQYGFRRAAVDHIAKAAGVSRTAVYLHFRDKEEIFRALAERVHEEQLQTAQTAMDQGGPIEHRIRRVLEARFARSIEITHGSAHGAELLDENSRICGDVSLAARRRTVRLLSRLVEDAAAKGELAPERLSLDPAAVARVLFDSARGAKGEPEQISPAAYRRRLAGVVRVLVAGLEPR